MFCSKMQSLKSLFAIKYTCNMSYVYEQKHISQMPTIDVYVKLKQVKLK